MSARDRLVGWYREASTTLDVLAHAAEFDPHEDQRRRLAMIEDRLDALELSSKRSAVGANDDAGLH